MSDERPPLLTWFGILHLVGGSFGLVITFCSGLGLLVTRGPQPGQGDPTDLTMRVRAMQIEKVPGFLAVEYFSVGMHFVLAMLLLMAGMGLLMRMSWARWTSLGYAVLSITFKIFLLVYSLTLVYPQVNKFLQEQARFNPQLQQPGFTTGFMLGFFGSLCLQTFFIIYPIAVLIAFGRPSAAEAFAPPRRKRKRRRPIDEDDDFDEDDDYDDR